MANKEKSPSRCRELRRAEGIIFDELRGVATQSRETSRKLRRERREMGRLIDKRDNFIKQLAATLVAPDPRSKLGNAMGVAATLLQGEIDLLGHQIERVRLQVQSFDDEGKHLKERQQYWQDALKRNAAEMGSLNCVV